MLEILIKRLHITPSGCDKDRVCINLFGRRYIFDLSAPKGKQYVGWYKP